MKDEQRSGRPSDVTSPANIRAVERLVMENRRIKIWEIQAETGISYGSISRILHDELLLSKVSARWVPKNLSAFDKHRRVECATANLTLLNADEKKFFARIVTGDETWLRCYDPESKQESMQWKHKNSPGPKKFLTQPASQKVMATIFWDCDGVLLLDYLPLKTTMTGTYYATLMKKLLDAVKEKRRGKLSAGVLLLHDNAPAHRADISVVTIHECGFTQLDHPPYSPDLAPSDFFFFPNLKRELRGKRFNDISEVTHAAEAYIDIQDKSFFSQGLQLLKERYLKCIAVQGDYVEK